MTKNCIILGLIALLLVLSVCAIADDNVSINIDIDNTTPSNETVTENTNDTLPENETQPEEIIDFEVVDFVPKEFKTGDTQFNIKVRNTGNTELKNLIAFVSGSGVSTYDVVAIDSLKPDGESYIIVMGSLEERGNITLNIRMGEKIFYQDIVVIDPDYEADQQNLLKLQKEEEAEKELIETLSVQLDELEDDFKLLESEFQTKKAQHYDVSEVNLNDLRDFLIDTHSSIVVFDVTSAKASIIRASDEYTYQKEKLDNATLIKKSIVENVRANLILISSIAASIITLFTFYEVMKKKKEGLSKKMMEVKVTFDNKNNSKSKKSKESKKKKDLKKE